MKADILTTQEELQKIENKLLNTKTPALSEKFEKLWQIKNNRIKQLEIESIKASKDQNFASDLELWHTASNILKNPLEIWKKKDIKIRQAMILAFFGSQIYLTKSDGLRTPQML